MESPLDTLNRLYREISGPSTKRKRPDLSSRVPCIALSAARLKAAWAFSKSSPRLMSSVPRVDQRKCTLAALPYIPFIDNRPINGLEIILAPTESPPDRILRDIMPAGRDPFADPHN